MKTLYIHIGTPRTATSSIQNFCCDNREQLIKAGYLYPEMPFVYPGKSAIRNGLFLTNKVMDENGNRDEKAEEEIFEQGMTLIGEWFSGIDNIILSDEGIWWGGYIRNPGIWKKIIDYSGKYHFQVKVIVYFRRQDLYLVSHWNQFVKHYTNALGNYSATLEQCLNEYQNYMNLDYFETLETISSQIGEENIICRRFSDAVKDGIINDFLSILNLSVEEETEFESIDFHKNSKLSENVVEIKRLVNTIPDLSRKENRVFEKILCKISECNEDDTNYRMMNENETKAFMEKFEEKNKMLQEKYLKDGKPLFSSNYQCDYKWEKENRYFVDDVIKFHTSMDLFLYRMMVENQKEFKQEIKRINNNLSKLETKTEKIHYNTKHPIKAFFRMIMRRVKK